MNTTAITKPDFPPEIAWIFRKPPLLLGESERENNELCKALRASIKPQNHLEWLLLKQALDSYWETGRLLKVKADLINMCWREALRQVFESILPGDEGERRRAAQAGADGWFTKFETQESARKLLLKHGIDEDAITAQAMALRLPELEKIDRLLEKSRIVQMATLREIEHYRIAGTWNGGKSLQQVVDEGLSSIPKIINAR